MKKMKKESGPSRIQKAQESMKRWKAQRDLCEKILEEPNTDGVLFSLIDRMVPPVDSEEWDEQDCERMIVSFAFGYVVGQMLDMPDIDITPIKDLLRKEKVLVYMPHEKKAT